MNKYLTKIAQLSHERKKEILDTGVIAGAGMLGNAAGHEILNLAYKGAKPGRLPNMLIGGLTGLAADYGAVKLNKAVTPFFEHKDNKK